MFKPLKIPVKFKKINLRNRYWQAQDYHFRDYLHTFTRQLKVDVNKSFRRELYRKLIHLSSLWIPLTIYFVREEIAIAIFSAIFIGNGLLEYGNFKKWKWARILFGRLFSRTLRSKESARARFQFSGSMYVMAAAVLCTVFFGKAYGTRQIYPHKSLEGTTAFFVSALLINMLFHNLEPFGYASVIACIFATLAEVFENKTRIDDNLAIPLAVGLVLTFLN